MMPTVDQVAKSLGIVVVLAPLLLTCLLGFSSLIGRKFSEETTSRLGHATIVCGLLAAIAVLGIMLAFGQRHIPIVLGDWVVVEQDGHPWHFTVKLIFDR